MKEVHVELYDTPDTVVMHEVVHTYVKDGLYCVVHDDHDEEKFVLDHIFRITEFAKDYDYYPEPEPEKTPTPAWWKAWNDAVIDPSVVLTGDTKRVYIDNKIDTDTYENIRKKWQTRSDSKNQEAKEAPNTYARGGPVPTNIKYWE